MPLVSAPSSNTRPALGASSRFSNRSTLDFPAPLGPVIATTSPARSAKLASRTIVFPPTSRRSFSARSNGPLFSVIAFSSVTADTPGEIPRTFRIPRLTVPFSAPNLVGKNQESLPDCA